MPVCGGWASCVCRYLATNECPAPYPLRDFRALATPASSPLPFSYLPFPKRNRPTSVSGGSRLRYWLCPPPLSAHNWDGLLRLYSFSVRHCNKQVRDAASPKSGILAEPFPQLLALGSWWSKVELRRITLLRLSEKGLKYTRWWVPDVAIGRTKAFFLAPFAASQVPVWSLSRIIRQSLQKLSEKSWRYPKRGPTRHPKRTERVYLAPIHGPNRRPERHSQPFSDSFYAKMGNPAPSRSDRARTAGPHRVT